MSIHWQFIRYGIVGLLSNGVLYIVYLGLTYFSMDPKSAMSLLYVTGVALTFALNKRWSFGHRGRAGGTFAKYISAYLIGYFTNLAALLICVDELGWSHQYVQAVMILLLAVLLFLVQKFWIFRPQAQIKSDI